MNSNFWSSTEKSNSPANAWNVNLNNGNTNNNTKVTNNYVRCVRRDLALRPSFVLCPDQATCLCTWLFIN